MFRRIMMPVDLAHAGRLEKALAVAADIARRHEAELTFVGVTGSEPGPVARTPDEFAAKLDAFAASAAESHGIPKTKAEAIRLHDVTADLDAALIEKARQIGADLIVIGSHVPGAMEFLIGSNAGHVAAHAPVSVFVVRG